MAEFGEFRDEGNHEGVTTSKNQKIGFLLITFILIGIFAWIAVNREELSEEEKYYYSLWNYWKVCDNPTQEGTCIPSTLNPHTEWRGHNNITNAILIGDIHGCADELNDLLEKVNYNPSRHSLILLGDLVNKGPNSTGVLKLAMEKNALAIRGNHDDHILAVAVERKILHLKLKEKNISVQDKSKILSKLEDTQSLAWTDDFTREQIEWLNSLPLTISLPDKFSVNGTRVILVHAGLVPDVDLQSQKLDDMLCMREVIKVNHKWEGRERGESKSKSWGSVWNGPYHVYFGHDARRRLQLHPRATGLDTGCVYGDQLTAAILPQGNLVQVDARQVYFSQED
eukprot:c15040_g1_i1.p1 GENE.c15040_g1_i1~~c15040_g1_i1.p1  ORF type:complete len:340 (+),score=164.87 c15040_g1_i1:195-1214(+)